MDLGCAPHPRLKGKTGKLRNFGFLGLLSHSTKADLEEAPAPKWKATECSKAISGPSCWKDERGSFLPRFKLCWLRLWRLLPASTIPLRTYLLRGGRTGEQWLVFEATVARESRGSRWKLWLGRGQVASSSTGSLVLLEAWVILTLKF